MYEVATNSPESQKSMVREAVAKGYHKLLSYKDEFEVARLLSESPTKAEAAFDGALKLPFHLAPPALGGARAGRAARPRSPGPSVSRCSSMR